MSPGQFMAWQWSGYPRFHASRTNLLLHIVVVPLFLVGNLALLAGLLTLSWPLVVGGAAAMGLSLAAQGRGHAMEANPPEPFTGPGQALARIFLEQWVTFPRFVLSGGRARALQQAA